MKLLKALISFPYQLIHALRCVLYDLKILQRKKLPAYTISIGNLSFGGTGKTPITIALAKYLAEQGLQVAVLTRGYKSKAKTSPIIINCSTLNAQGSTKDNSTLSIEHSVLSTHEVGDEAMEMYNEFTTNPNITLVVDPNRYRGGMAVYKQQKIDVFILDDGLQHIQLDRDLEIILKNINEAGFYREFPWAESKADHLIYTKVDDAWIKNHPGEKYAKFNLSLTKTLHPEAKIGVFTAIADPNTLVKNVQEYLRKQGHCEENLLNIEKRFYPDHHPFSLGEVMDVLALGINIISTRKDLVKIPLEYKDKFTEARIEVEFSPSDLAAAIRRGVVYDAKSNKSF